MMFSDVTLVYLTFLSDQYKLMWCIESDFKVVFKLKKSQQTQAMFVAGKNGSRLRGKKVSSWN